MGSESDVFCFLPITRVFFRNIFHLILFPFLRAEAKPVYAVAKVFLFFSTKENEEHFIAPLKTPYPLKARPIFGSVPKSVSRGLGKLFFCVTWNNMISYPSLWSNVILCYPTCHTGKKLSMLIGIRWTITR